MNKILYNYITGVDKKTPEAILDNVAVFNTCITDFDSYLRSNKASFIRGGSETKKVVGAKLESLYGAINNPEVTTQKVEQCLSLMRDIYILIEYIKKAA